MFLHIDLSPRSEEWVNFLESAVTRGLRRNLGLGGVKWQQPDNA